MANLTCIKDPQGSNLFWLLTSSAKEVVVVDPGNSQPILAYLHANNLRADSILITHHHGDHTAGIQDITDEYHCPVLGPENEKIESITQAFTEGDSFERMGVQFKVLSLPGHTLDHIGFIADDKHFLCGDTLFGCGCGKVFEGTMEQMYATLQKCAQLPATTLLYWGHEMTTANLAFASQVESDNKALLKRFEDTARLLKENDGIAAPIPLAEELATNPFLRVDQATVKQKAEEKHGSTLKTPAEVFSVLRRWKDSA